MLLDSSCFPGTEQFKIEIQSMENMRNAVRELPQSSAIKFDHLVNMQDIDYFLKKVRDNLNGNL